MPGLQDLKKIKEQLEAQAAKDKAVQAARALAANTELDARTIAQKSMQIAGEICIYTNTNIVLEEL